MSKFSDYLRKILEESGESISSVARASGIERTSIHKALSDERQLSYNSVRALARHFQLTIEERREFLQAYDILLQGEEAWKNRQAICEMFSQLSAIHFTAESIYTNSSFSEIRNGLAEGEFKVHNLIHTILEHDIRSCDASAPILMFLPTDMNLSEEFMEMWMKKINFCVEQIFCFTTALSKDYSENIRLLQQIIPLCMVSGGKYSPYYFRNHSRNLSINPFHYFIVTPHCLILIDQDQSAAWIETSPSLIQYYSEYFRSILEQCDLLVNCASSAVDILNTYTPSASDVNLSLSMFSQPCLGRYFTSDAIRKYLQGVDDQSSPVILELAEKRYGPLRIMDRNYYTVFSEKGLHEFTENGVLADMPSQYVSPIKPEDRLLFLQSLRTDIATGKVTGLIVRPSCFHIPSSVALFTDSMGGIHFATTEDFIYGAYYCDIHIPDEFLCNAFRDFILYLPNSHLVYSRNDTLRILDEEINGLME